MNDVLIYLVKVSICHTAFYLLYRWWLGKLTYFQWNRIYLLAATVLGFVIPLFQVGIWNAETSNDPIAINLAELLWSKSGIDITERMNSSVNNWYSVVVTGFFSIYLAGVVISLNQLCQGLLKVFKLIKENKVSRDEGHQIVQLENEAGYFSFMNYVFINNTDNLSPEEYNHVFKHEQIHIKQKHSYDLIFLELVIVLCWFNPIVRKIRKQLGEIHEYLADLGVAGLFPNLDDYTDLIFKLYNNSRITPVVHEFSVVNLKKRISMLHVKKSNKMKKLYFMLTIPLLAILLATFSFTKKEILVKNSDTVGFIENQPLIIHHITWSGNTQYSSEYLTGLLGIKQGDLYNKVKIEKRLNYNSDGRDISSLYMDKGYLFFNVEINEEVNGEKISLTFKVYEGELFMVDQIIISGNSTISNSEILKMIELKSGDKFNRSKLTASQKNLAESGLFNSEKIVIVPIPKDNHLVDLEFTLTEI